MFFLFLIIFWLPQFSDAAVANILWREEGTAVKLFCCSDNVLVCFNNSIMGHSPLTLSTLPVVTLGIDQTFKSQPIQISSSIL